MKLQLSAALAIALATAVAVPASQAAKPVVGHAIGLVFDLDAHRVEVVDTLSIPDGVTTFRLGEAFARQLQGFDAVADSSDDGTALVRFTLPPDRPDGRLILGYGAQIFESTAEVVFSRENVGREIQATVSDEGIYLAASSHWLPIFEGALARHRLSITTPAGWEPVTQGRRTVHRIEDGKQRTVWDAVNPSDGLTLVAGPYRVTERDLDGVTAYTYFLADEPRLVETYLERTGAYLQMYREMIGPYPYAKFATVENWFPTGYGMPSYTLLGGTVLRLPFIPYTSFGHEIAHNWWGNSTFVSDQGGNWCEGITVYCADYHYKELESPAAAREYRRNLLKDYAAYVVDGKDLPLTGFKSRHSGATRAVGYGKSMMTFHMVDRLIGREAFLESLRDVWSSHRFSEASWLDFMDSFRRHGGIDMAAFHHQWVEQTGAPLIRLLDARQEGDRVVCELEVEGAYPGLRIPVVIRTPDREIEEIATMDRSRQTFAFDIPGATGLAVDPDYHVFRRLHPDEIEPTLSRVFGDDDPVFVVPAGLAGAAARKFAEAYVETGEPRYPDPEQAGTHCRILVNPDGEQLSALLPPGVQVVSGLVFIDGKRYSLKDHDVVIAVDRPGGGNRTDLVVLGQEAARLAALADRIGHYGKYSWLVFPARGRPVTGNWATNASMLVRNF